MPKEYSVLIIDDDSILREMLSIRLGKVDGHNVLLAGSGAEGLKMARRSHPNLVLLDWMMPEMSGLEVLGRLKRENRTKDIPVYMLTGKSLVRDVEKTLAGGADGYFTKPFDLVDISNRVRTALSDGGA